MTIQTQLVQATRFDVAHADRGADTLPLNHHRIGPQESVRNNRSEAVDVDDMVYFGLGRNGHRQAATSSFSASSTASSRSAPSVSSSIGSSSMVSGRLVASARTSSLPVTIS